MPRDYNVNLSISGGNRRGAFRGGNLVKTKTTLNSRGQNSTDDTEINLSKVFTIGLAFNKAQQANELIGAYTGRRHRQKKVDVGLTFAKYGIGIGINPLAGGVYAVGDLAYRGLGYAANISNQNLIAERQSKLSGNNANSGRRYRGGYI